MRALFFDLDGTLTDINQREIEVIHDTLNHFGMSLQSQSEASDCSNAIVHGCLQELGI